VEEGFKVGMSKKNNSKGWFEGNNKRNVKNENKIKLWHDDKWLEQQQ